MWDVGVVFDAWRGRFEQLQRGSSVRVDGTTYSSAGLVWRDFWSVALRGVVGDCAAGDRVSRAAVKTSSERLHAELQRLFDLAQAKVG